MSIELHCPECKANFRINRPLRIGSPRDGDVTPREGDYTVCGVCGAVLRRGAEQWRLITDDEWLDMPLDDRTIIQRAQSVTAANRNAKAGKAPTDEDADAALGLLTLAIPSEMMNALPWIIVRALITRGGEPHDAMVHGLSKVAKIIMARDTTREEDLKSLVPIIYAQAYMVQEGDREKMLAMLEQHIREQAEKHGFKGDISDLLI